MPIALNTDIVVGRSVNAIQRELAMAIHCGTSKTRSPLQPGTQNRPVPSAAVGSHMTDLLLPIAVTQACPDTIVEVIGSRQTSWTPAASAVGHLHATMYHETGSRLRHEDESVTCTAIGLYLALETLESGTTQSIEVCRMLDVVVLYIRIACLAQRL